MALSQSAPGIQPSGRVAWFCIRTHSKREHIAGQWLKRQLGIETYVPRIRFRRLQQRGPVLFVDALFPNYLFAHFDLPTWVQRVQFAPGVAGIVRFGAHCPTVPDTVIEELRATIGADQVHVIEDTIEPGQTVQIAGGPLHGLQAVITRVMPQRQRLQVLLDFLGRQTTIELSTATVTRLGDARLRVFQ